MKKVPRRDRTALPKLQMNPGSSATEMMQVLQQWMSQMGLVLATWTDSGSISSLKPWQIMSSFVVLGQEKGRYCMGNPGRHSHCQRQSLR